MKYYQPELEEFHLGFEYEEYSQGYQYDVKLLTENPEVQLQILSEPQLTEGWVKRIYNQDDFIILEDGEISTYVPEVRVKHLDEQDIQDLGWKVAGESKSPFTDMIYTTFKITNEVGFNTGSDYYLVLTENNRIEITVFEYSSYGGDKGNLFFNIKNKSELRKLMKHLGI